MIKVKIKPMTIVALLLWIFININKNRLLTLKCTYYCKNVNYIKLNGNLFLLLLFIIDIR